MRFFLYCLPITAIFFWSANNVVTKIAASNISPGAVSFYRWALAALLLTPFFIRKTMEYRGVIRKHFIKLVVLASLGMVIYQSLGYIAAHYTSASNIGIILGLMPLLTFIISIRVFKLKVTWGAIFGIPLSLYGILFFLSDGHPLSIIHRGFGRGDLLILVATFAYALYGVLIKYWKIPLPTWVLIYVQTVIASFILLPWFMVSPATAMTANNLMIIMYAGIFASIFSPALWLISLGRLGAYNTSIFMNLIPVFTLLIAVVFIGEKLWWHECVGAAIILSGVMLSQLWTAPVKSGVNEDLPLKG